MVGCSNKPKEEPLLQAEVTVKMDSGFIADKVYDVKFNYDDGYFLTDAKKYDKGLSELSFGSCLASKNPYRGNEFYNTIEYKDVVAKNYDNKDIDNCAYMLAHKYIRDYEVVSISFRGFDYQQEWANNFKLGSTGNHKGFSISVNAAYEEIKSYISYYCNEKPLKLWINGYSRGGALSNMLASKIIKDNVLEVSQENMYVYTFEAPRGLISEYATGYSNVHNIVNDVDLVTSIPPESYGFYRCGVDENIYNADVSNIVRRFDPNISIPSLVTTSSYKNDKELLDYILDGITNNPGIAEDRSANDREHFSNNYEDGIGYILGLIFSLSGNTRARLISNFKSMGTGALTMLKDETGTQLCYWMLSYLNTDSLAYEYETLLSSCAVFCKAANSLGSPLMNTLMNYGGNVTRLLDMHYPEVCYSLLTHSHQ